MSLAVELALGVMPVLFCGTAALLSLTVLVQTRAGRKHPDHLSGLSGLGAVVILGWGWSCFLMADIANARLTPLAVSLGLGLIVKVVVESEASHREDRIILGGITLLPLGVQVFF